MGKHPAARDFISTGPSSALIERIGAAVDEGYSLAYNEAAISRSWRFFVRDERKNVVAIGILKDSQDAVGRRYPLIVAGSGEIDGWDTNWEDTFSRYSHQYSQIEYLCAKKLGSLDELKAGISRFAEPHVSAAGKSLYPALNTVVKNDLQLFIPLTEGDEEQLSGQVSAYLSNLKKVRPESPAAVFVGGTFERSWLCVFRDKLTGGDIKKLWLET